MILRLAPLHLFACAIFLIQGQNSSLPKIQSSQNVSVAPLAPKPRGIKNGTIRDIPDINKKGTLHDWSNQDKVNRLSPAFGKHSFSEIPQSELDALTMNVQNVDVDRLRRKIDQLLSMYGHSVEPAPSRRQYHLSWYRIGIPGAHQADEFRLKRILLDNMLQLLYMARHKLRSMELSRHYNTKDLGFRVAFSYRQSRLIWKKLAIIFKLHNVKADIWDNCSYHLILHHRAARLHLDFMYLFWVMVNIDNAVKKHSRISDKLQQRLAGAGYPPGYVGT